MGTLNNDPRAEGGVRCRVCGNVFENEAELEHHVRDKGLLW